MDHFPTVSTCLEVSSYDLHVNAISQFYCPEKEMGMINQGEAEEPRPSPLIPPAPADVASLGVRACPLRAACMHSLSPTKLQTRQE